MKTFKSV